MKINFLEKTRNVRRLILIFPGWSCNAYMYRDFTLEGWDVAVVEEYENIQFDSSSIKAYTTVSIFAWSLGVFMAAVSGIEEMVASAFALNGTLIPVSDTLGIPSTIFKATADNLSLRNLSKFRRRMSGSSEVFNTLFDGENPDENIDVLRKQLLNIMKWQETASLAKLPWKKVFLSEEDAIFPYSNMRRFWENYARDGRPEIISLKAAPHYVPLKEIIRLSLPNGTKVAHRFSKAASTYDRSAVAQREIAHSLADFIVDDIPHKNIKVLEIGPGTGLFTREILNKFTPQEIDFVDISSFPPAIDGLNSRFFQQDAEKWMEECSDIYDAIISSSTFQWFVNLPLFFSNASRALKDKGTLAFSIFTTGNLSELDVLRPAPIAYHSPEEIEKMLSPWFSNIKKEEKTVILTFDSPADLFRHLRETGVGGSAPERKYPVSAIRKMRTLTFRSVFFSCKKDNTNLNPI